MHPQSLGAISLLAVGLGLVVFAVIITDRRAQQLLLLSGLNRGTV
jgi:hypothetical protein